MTGTRNSGKFLQSLGSQVEVKVEGPGTTEERESRSQSSAKSKVLDSKASVSRAISPVEHCVSRESACYVEHCVSRQSACYVEFSRKLN